MRFSSTIVLATCITACAIDPEPRLYGTWFEPLTGERVILDEDGSLEWFGEAGSFEFARNSNAFCNIARSGCPDGEVLFRLPSGTFRLSYRDTQFTSTPELWSSALRSYGGPIDGYTHDGRTFDFIRLVREGYAPIPYRLNGFQPMMSGLDEDEGLYPANGGSYITRGELIRSSTGLKRWDNSQKRWVALNFPAETTYGLQFGATHLFSDDGWSSGDLGQTWQQVPSTSTIPRPNNEWIRETFMLNSSVIVTRQRTNEGRTEVVEATDIFKLDLNAPSDGWQLIGQMPMPSQSGRMNELSVHEATGTFMTREFDADVFVSADQGTTWTRVPSSGEKCAGTWPSNYGQGFVCKTGTGSATVFNAYNVSTASWFTYRPSEDGFSVDTLSSSQHSEGFTFVAQEAVWFLRDSGELIKVTDLPSTLPANAQVLGPYTVVQQFGLWFKRTD